MDELLETDTFIELKGEISIIRRAEPIKGGISKATL